jgi:predicted O-methyltransferase YrrM
LNVQVSAAVAGLRAALDAYRENVVLGKAEPRFAAALARAGFVEGYTTPGELSLLYHLAVAADGPGRIVEIGSYVGRSTIVLASAVMDTGREPVVAIDPHTAALMIEGLPPRDTRNEFLANVSHAGVRDHVELIQEYSVQAAAEWTGDPIRLHFVDGWHSREAVLEDVGSWAQRFTPDVVAVFDDYLSSEGVRQAVRELQASGIVRRDGIVVGKMAAFGPPHLLAKAPTAAGGRALMRVSDDRRERLIRLGER